VAENITIDQPSLCSFVLQHCSCHVYAGSMHARSTEPVHLVPACLGSVLVGLSRHVYRVRVAGGRAACAVYLARQMHVNSRGHVRVHAWRSSAPAARQRAESSFVRSDVLTRANTHKLLTCMIDRRLSCSCTHSYQSIWKEKQQHEESTIYGVIFFFLLKRNGMIDLSRVQIKAKGD